MVDATEAGVQGFFSDNALRGSVLGVAIGVVGGTAAWCGADGVGSASKESAKNGFPSHNFPTDFGVRGSTPAGMGEENAVPVIGVFGAGAGIGAGVADGIKEE